MNDSVIRINKREQIFRWFSYFFYLLVVLLVLYRGIATTNDSAGYIGMSSIRSPLYPLLIKLFYFIGGNYYQTWLLCFQVLLGAFGIFVFCCFIHRYFRMAYWLTFVFSLFLLFPYVVFGKIANVVMTEAIAYPIFLIAMRFLAESIADKRLRPFVIYLLCTILLVLTRGQFLFLYPVSAIVFIYFSIYLKNKRKKLLRALLIFISCIIFTSICERTYNYILYRHFSKVTLSGVQLSAAAFYLSEKEDVKIFNDSTVIKFFERVQQHTHIENSWTFAYDKKTAGNSGYGYYEMVYNKIIWGAVYPEARNLVPYTDVSNDLMCWKYVNQLTKSVSLKLIGRHWKEFLRLYATNVLFGLGYKHNSILFFLLLIVFLVFSFRFHNKYAVLFSLFLVISLANVCLIALLEPSGEYRYLIYNDALYLTLMIISINNWRTLLKNKALSGINSQEPVV